MTDHVLAAIRQHAGGASRRHSLAMLGGASLAVLTAPAVATAAKASKKVKRRARKKSRKKCRNQVDECRSSLSALCSDDPECEANFLPCCADLSDCQAGSSLDCFFSHVS